MKQSTLDGLTNYATHHTPTGSFLRAVLENDLMEAFGRADEDNLRDIHEILSHVYNNIPASCHGSPEIVNNWLKKKV